MERTILVAFTVEAKGGASDAEMEEPITRLLSQNIFVFRRARAPQITDWWVAEDRRFDGSDRDSAVFVTPGKQAEASHLLHEHDLTASYNVVPGLTVSERLDLIEKSGWPIAYDGCHKLYFLQDEGRVAEARELGYDIHPSTKLRFLYEEDSCGLRFVSRWGHDNADFDHEWNIDQGEVG